MVPRPKRGGSRGGRPSDRFRQARAVPEASVNFQISREEAQARAQKFVTGLGENAGGYESTIVFAVDDNAKVYLERQLGLQQANKLMSSELNIWFWDVRFFK